MAGLDPAMTIVRHGRAKLIGIAGSSPAMTRMDLLTEQALDELNFI